MKLKNIYFHAAKTLLSLQYLHENASKVSQIHRALRVKDRKHNTGWTLCKYEEHPNLVYPSLLRDPLSPPLKDPMKSNDTLKCQ